MTDAPSLWRDVEGRQRRAADPRAFAWVSANAGAGKTKVLTDRVIRLLLAGTAPARILCLTFTRAAAANMTARVFDTLGAWVTLDDAALAERLGRLEGRRPSAATMARARRLFARAVETPGGLKIDTIHGFCERLLHLAPFEADVPARFKVLDESKAGELMAEARDAVLAEASRDEGSGTARALAAASLAGSPDRMIAALDCAVRDGRIPDGDDEAAAALATLRRDLGLSPGEDADTVVRRIVEDGLPEGEWRTMALSLARSAKDNDRKQSARIDLLLAAREPRQKLSRLRGILLTKDRGPRQTLVTQSAPTEIAERLLIEQRRVVALEEVLRAAETLDRTAAIYALARAVRSRYRASKVRLGALDFDDLVAKALAVLSREEAAWVLYKLDRGVDHVLIDEAQDTNPDQWRILQRLTEDFTSGAGAGGSGRVRTLFAVGDPKQSIFSFQGADPEWFETSRRHWTGKAAAAAIDFADVRLDVSFRSAPAVLEAVDATFAVENHYRGLSYDDAATGTLHRSARPDIPGHVELWPIARREKGGDDPKAWALPVDEPEPTSPPVMAANRVAALVRRLTREGDEAGRVFRPGEVLILARKRGPAFFAVIRALRGVGVPVAGADRFDIGEHIAVEDLVAAGTAALRPENDLVLACALKSPLVGLDDADLIRITRDREDREPLYAALARHAAAGDEAAAQGATALAEWRALAARNGPFGFYAALLGPMEGRFRLISRLGGEAADAIDAFLCYAESAEMGDDAPSLTAFLARFESAEHTIKRDLDAAIDEVRVMTVHGAKGLEATVVVVLDGCDAGGPEGPFVPIGAAALPAWVPGRKEDCAVTTAARALLERRALDEHNRLLYVAMTRAKDRLVIAPFATGAGEPPAHSWCNMIRAGFEHAGRAPEAIEAPEGQADVWRDPPAAGMVAGTPATAAAPPEPDWLRAPVEDEPARVTVLRPSAAPGRRSGGASPSRSLARLRGVLTHALIERLPRIEAERRDEVGRSFLQARAGALPPEVREEVLQNAIAVLEHPDLQVLFGPQSRAEVPLSGTLALGGGSAKMAGTIDRLAVLDDRIVLADFKTGPAPTAGAATPAAYLRQLALYRAVLQDIHGARPVQAFLVWTEGPKVVELSSDDLDAALQAAVNEGEGLRATQGSFA